ncbi:unnamed protein product [Thlaspi arvense]|uniref:Carboxypeptidase n=1 Tax=Thlaspi arvense TaxID=13288 RepID=A0AAU9SY49_THLAR|nr:unnamed protein product [Thlaspi arvense]
MKRNALWLLCLLVLPAIACGRKPEKKVTASSGRKEDDLVTALPGQPPVNFRHYAGYVNLGPQQTQKALFYWFFEAQQNSSRRPLVLWLNGGPGCSSIAYGAAQELGPFLARTKGHNLTFNQFSWNKAANMLFLEAPVGVGFSYTNNSMDLQKLGDQATAADSLAFLINWFTKFPEFRSNEFYITGESYAGHYVPQLAELIYDRNKKVTRGSQINLKGFMIGNAVINEETDMAGLVDYAWSHAIVSDELHNNLHGSCRFDEEDETSNKTLQCYDNFKNFMEAYSDIDIYSIYTPVCLSSSSSSSPRKPKPIVSPRLLTSDDMWDRLPAGYDPCTEGYAEAYFNRKDVQVALHANVTNLPYPYTPCSGVIRKWNDASSTVIPIIQKLLSGGLRIWIYSGDTDGRVPVTSTRYSIKKMGPKVESPWRSWFHKSQVAGWVETYAGGLTFATVRGAGHQGVGVLAKSNTFAKSPRQLQFEADINKLFMFTSLIGHYYSWGYLLYSYNRLGRDAEEADAEEIIEMAGKATLSEQEKQVHENIHYQLQNFCASMDEILLPDSHRTKELNGPESESKSGLTFAIGKDDDVPTADKPVVPETKPLKLAEVSQRLKDRIGYTLEIKSSLIPHKDAGQGCFIDGEADVGAVLAFYPGVIYYPPFHRYIPGYPNVDAQNSYLITKYDGTVINAQPWGRGGESREVWNSSFTTPEIRADAKTPENCSDKVWKMPSRPLEGSGNVEAVLEMRNPLAFGHFANHPSKDMDPNVMICPYDFPLSEKAMRAYIPNVAFGNAGEANVMKFGSLWSRTGSSSSLDAPVLKTLVLVATRALCNEELMLNYGLSKFERRPEWYTTVDEE